MADEEINENEADAPSLSDEELHDVTEASTAQNELEAIALIDALEEVGIPAMRRGGSINFGAMTPTAILVPRKLLEDAKRIIEQSRAHAEGRGIEDAFKPEYREQAQSEDDPIVDSMSQLAGLDKDARDNALSAYVADWVAESRPGSEVARYLAAAGLSREEADALIASVSTGQKELLKQSHERRAQRGVTLIVVGLPLVVLPFLLPWLIRSLGYLSLPLLLIMMIPFIVTIGVCLVVAGAAIASHSRRAYQKLEE